MTDDEAEALLRELDREHFGPLEPGEPFCGLAYVLKHGIVRP